MSFWLLAAVSGFSVAIGFVAGSYHATRRLLKRPEDTIIPQLMPDKHPPRIPPYAEL